MLKSNYELEVLVNGHPAKEYFHKNKHYMEGKQGSRFSLRMKNNSNEKALFIPSIDGLSIMDGNEASFSSRGYVINAHDSLTVEGWRTSKDKVAEFYFSSQEESYADKTKKGDNIGIIGCAVFKERVVKKEYIHYPYPYYIGCNCNYNHCNHHINTLTTTGGYSTLNNLTGLTTSTGSSGISMAASSTSSANYSMSSLGTGFGDDKYSPTTTVGFDKESNPIEVFQLLYNTRENLKAIGVEFKKPMYITPSAFPKEEYCKRP